jgi:hypothetical protein
MLFPDDALVSIPYGHNLDGNCHVSVRIDSSTIDVDWLSSTFGDRLHAVELLPKAAEALVELARLEHPHIRGQVPDEDFFHVGEAGETLRRKRAMFHVAPDSGLKKRLNFLTGLGIIPHVDPGMPVENEGVLLDAVEFYLRNPILRTPVEPFHSVLKTLSRRRGLSLPDLEFERLPRHFYVTETGEITLSRRFADANVFFGTLEDTWDEIVASEAYERLSNLDKLAFERSLECMFCPHFRVCEAYFKAIDGTADCEAWKSTFAALQGEVEEARQLIERHAGEQRHE